MYCNKCGKEIESGTVCNECLAKETVTIDPDYIMESMNKMPEPDNRMFGFGKALAATILSWVAFFVTYFALIFSMVAYEIGNATGMVFLVLALPPLLISLAFSISSIKTFNARKATCAKPIATLVLGIIGLATTIFSLVLFNISFFALISLF